MFDVLNEHFYLYKINIVIVKQLTICSVLFNLFFLGPAFFGIFLEYRSTFYFNKMVFKITALRDKRQIKFTFSEQK